ncbi:hypothetical protein LCGC14_2476350, partial [marine sediment metagenome]
LARHLCYLNGGGAKIHTKHRSRAKHVRNISYKARYSQPHGSHCTIAIREMRFTKSLLNIIFPPLCLSCRKHITSSLVLCNVCEQNITIRGSFSCSQCNSRLPTIQNTCHPNEQFTLAAATSYDNNVIRALIHAFKYGGTKDVLTPLSNIIQQYTSSTIESWKLVLENCVVIPIPLYRRRKRVRGFNQAALIAEVFIQHLQGIGNLHIEYGNLIKIRNTLSQTKLNNYEQRVNNVRDSFVLKYPEQVVGKNVILVDDVFTSGATMKEAVKVLKEAGAKKVVGFVIARA